MSTTMDYEQLFKLVRDDAADEIMETIIDNNWFNFKFPRALKSFNNIKILCHRCPIISAAIYFGSIDTFRFLIANQADLNAEDEDGNLPIAFAIAGGQIEILFMLTDMNLLDKVGFILSAKYNQFEIMQYIWNNLDISIEEVDTKGFCAIHYAANNGNIEMLDFLIKHGANINATTLHELKTPIHFAAVHPNKDALEFLLGIPDINAASEDKRKETPLHLASNTGFIENLILLCSRPETNINSLDEDNRTPIHYATLNGKIDAVSFLLSQPNIDITIEDGFDRNPLFEAIYMQHIEITKMFLNHPKVKTVGSKSTALHIAIRISNIEIVKYLLDNGVCDVNALDENEETSLCTACRKNDEQVIKAILSVPGRKLGKIFMMAGQYGARRKIDEQLTTVAKKILETDAPDCFEEFKAQCEPPKTENANE